MSRPVSIVVWRDAKTDPPTGDMERMVLVQTSGGQTSRFRAYNVKPYSHATYDNYPAWQPRYWAELPVVSDLTDDDVLDAAQHVRHSALSVRNSTAARSRAALSDRLRAALDGEKPDSDGLYHDRIHHEPGRARGAKTVRTLGGEKEET